MKRKKKVQDYGERRLVRVLHGKPVRSQGSNLSLVTVDEAEAQDNRNRRWYGFMNKRRRVSE